MPTEQAAGAWRGKPAAPATLTSATSPCRPPRSEAPPSAAPKPAQGAAGRSDEPVSAPAGGYDLVFWLCFVANSSIMVAVSILFRYADYIRLLGGGEWELGLVTGVGMIGALSMRLFQGVGIDRYGSRRIWLSSLALTVAALLLHLQAESLRDPTVFIARMLLMTSLAGAFGASITFVSLRVPPRRVAEMIGVLGSSGFVGMALGPVIGDWLFAGGEVTPERVDRMFACAACMAGLSLLFAALATAGQTRQPPPRRRVPALRLIRKRHPGALLIVAFAMGAGVTLPHVFLRAYTAELDMPGIRTFFLIYAAMAFAFRITTRKMSETHGVRAMIVLGLSLLAASMVAYLAVFNEWLLAVPAILGGMAHALLFPAVVGGGSTTFPRRYRGLGTTLMLAMFDLGSLFGQPFVGGLLEGSRRLGLPPYPVMFVTLAVATLTVAAVFYAQTLKPHSRAAQACRLG